MGLKKLITTCYKNQRMDRFSQNDSEEAIKLEYTGGAPNSLPTPDDIGVTPLKGDGDFRSQECIAILKKADIVVTNPPFSLFSKYVALLSEYDKKFIIIGHQNAITYKEVFPLIKENRMWLGYGFKRNMAHFIAPHYQDTTSDADHREGMIRVSGVVWYTSLDYKLTVYQCQGTDSEKLDWFRTINIAGEKLTDQELRNAVYASSWTAVAKRYFSKTQCATWQLANKYMTGFTHSPGLPRNLHLMDE